MKKTSWIFLVGLVVGAATTFSAMQFRAPVGRYSLHTDSKSGTLVLMDTINGKVWTSGESIKDGGLNILPPPGS